MSQFTHPAVSIRDQVSSHRIAVLSALFALLCTAAVVLVLAIDSDSPSTGSTVVKHSQTTVRYDGGPDEGAVAAAVSNGLDASPTSPALSGPRYDGGPDESAVAAAVASGLDTGASGTPLSGHR